LQQLADTGVAEAVGSGVGNARETSSTARVGNSVFIRNATLLAPVAETVRSGGWPEFLCGAGQCPLANRAMRCAQYVRSIATRRAPLGALPLLPAAPCLSQMGPLSTCLFRAPHQVLRRVTIQARTYLTSFRTSMPTRTETCRHSLLSTARRSAHTIRPRANCRRAANSCPKAQDCPKSLRGLRRGSCGLEYPRQLSPRGACPVRHRC